MTDPAQGTELTWPAEPAEPASAPPPETGDPAVDEALARLHRSAEEGDLDAQADAGEAVHRALQTRLSDLGGD